MSATPARRVFILGGGASLGAQQVGAMRHLEEQGIRERWIDYPTLLESPLDLSFIVPNLSRGEAHFVSNRQDHSAADLRKLVTAGYSIPILFPPVACRGEWYVDGGFAWNVPILQGHEGRARLRGRARIPTRGGVS